MRSLEHMLYLCQSSGVAVREASAWMSKSCSPGKCGFASINQTSLVGSAFQAGNVLIVQLFDFQYRIARILGIALIKGHGEILLTKVTSFRQLSELRKYRLAIACCAALAALLLRFVSCNATVGLRPDGQLCKSRWKGRGSVENRKGTTQLVGHCISRKDDSETF